MEETDEEEDMEVNEEEVRELSMEGPKEAEESEEGPIRIASSDQAQRQQRRDEPVREKILTWCLVLLQVD